MLLRGFRARMVDSGEDFWVVEGVTAEVAEGGLYGHAEGGGGLGVSASVVEDLCMGQPA